MSDPLVYVITLNWNRRDNTLECLDSLTRLTYSNLRWLVVDNGSTDSSPQAVAECFPQIEQIRNERNLGFAGGFNVGLRHALRREADLVFMVNNDALIAPEAMEALVQRYSLTNVTFIDWLEQAELINHVTQANVCLGAFGQTPQSLMTIQNKIYEGLAMGRRSSRATPQPSAPRCHTASMSTWWIALIHERWQMPY